MRQLLKKRIVFMFRSRSTLANRNPIIENVVQSRDTGKRSSIVLLRTTKTETPENVDTTSARANDGSAEKHFWCDHRLTKICIAYNRVLHENIFQWYPSQIRVIGSIKLEICTKMLTNLREKLGGKFPSTTWLLRDENFSSRSVIRWREFLNWRNAQ